MQVCGQKVRRLREERGYSLQDLAGRAGVSVSYLSEIERGAKRPSLKTLERLAAALNLPREQLVEDSAGDGLFAGERIRALREEKGYSLADFAASLNLSPSYLSEIERGKITPAIDTLKTIAAALSVPPGLLLARGATLGVKLKAAREEQGLTQAGLAAAAGVSAGLVGQIEQGKVQPSLKTLEKLGQVLGISPCHFLAEDAGLEDLLQQMGPGLRDLLGNESVQAVLRLICSCSDKELRFILNFIQLYKKSH